MARLLGLPTSWLGDAERHAEEAYHYVPAKALLYHVYMALGSPNGAGNMEVADIYEPMQEFEDFPA